MDYSVIINNQVSIINLLTDIKQYLFLFIFLFSIYFIYIFVRNMLRR